MAIHLAGRDLVNVRQLEVAVKGPDGATHLILCTGIANFGTLRRDTYTFFVGPRLVRRQFVGVIASAALSTIYTHNKPTMGGHPTMDVGACLGSIDAAYDDETGQVKVQAEVLSVSNMTRLAISYNVSILAEMPVF